MHRAFASHANYLRSSLADATILAATFEDMPAFSDTVSASTEAIDSTVSNPAFLSFSSVALPTPLISPTSRVEASGLSASTGSSAGFYGFVIWRFS